MSHVTNVILTMSGLEWPRGDNEPNPGLDGLHAWLKEQKIPGIFKLVDDYAGGPKAIEGKVLMCAFNNINPDDLVAAVKAQPWVVPEWIQLFIKDQDDDLWWEAKTPK